MENNNKQLFWGYLHQSGTIQVKRYFGELDLAEAYESPFVKQVISQFWASDPDEALKIIKEKLHEKN